MYIEEFIKTYIMKYSSILILVVGMMTFSEQKLINKIIFQCNKLNKKYKNYLIIIHNLQELETNNQVENYIKNILLNSANFNLKLDDKKEDYKKGYLFDLNNHSIKHYIFAKKNLKQAILIIKK